MKHECGVAAVIDLAGERDVVPLGVALAEELQHRGELGAGIAWLQREGHGQVLRVLKDHGLVRNALSRDRLAEAGAAGGAVIAHTRYATNTHMQHFMLHPLHYSARGERMDRDLPPPDPDAFPVTNVQLPHEFAFAFNGALTNVDERTRALRQTGHAPRTPGDTEIIGRTIIAQWGRDARMKMGHVMQGLDVLDGAFNIVMLSGSGEVVAVRDPHAFHPLVMGRRDSILAIASEDMAIRRVLPGAVIEDVMPGHMVHAIPDGRVVKHFPLWMADPKHCFFEPTYFMDHRGHTDGIHVANARYESGRILAKQDMKRPRSDIAMPVPESAKIATNGYVDARGIRRVDAILKNHPDDIDAEYVGRSFTATDPLQKARVKYQIDADMVRGRSIMLIDDSVVRGTTMRVLVTLLREAGAAEIHLRIASPAIIGPCFYGIDFQTVKELIARKYSDGNLVKNGALPHEVLAAIAAELGVDSIVFLPVDEVPHALGKPGEKLCRACVTLEYPTPGGRSLHVLAEQHTCSRGC